LIKRTVEISRESAHLSSRFHQLVLKRDGQVVGQIPGEDIGVVLVDHPGVTYTHAALSLLADCGAAVVLCGSDHLPNAMILPMADHGQVVWRIGVQLAAKRPLRKQLWRQLVRAKIRAQAANLSPEESPRAKLLALAVAVRSGDPANVEAQAARIYWQHWMAEEEFRRNPDLPGTNAFLNYGYAVLRAAVARAIVAAGLLPALGLHHRNRSNAFCLADDLVEPLRPLVDDRVRELRRAGYDELTQEAKSQILNRLAAEVRVADDTGPRMVSLHRMVASLVQCYQGQSKRLAIPQAVGIGKRSSAQSR